MKRGILEKANDAFKRGDFREALSMYHEFKLQHPEMAALVEFNISLIKKRTVSVHDNIKSTVNGKIIVYTCNFGGYESVKEPISIDSAVDYILFTDDAKIVSKNWKVVLINEKLEDPRRSSRLPKILPHQYLPPHEFSVYLDSSLELKISDLRKMVDECLDGKDIALYKHSKRACVYDEIQFVMNSTDREVKNKELCIKAIKKYEDINYPKKNGLFENGLIVRRNTFEIQNLSEIWWREYISGSERDQFTFMYALWISGVKPNPIKYGSQVRINDYVNFHKHKYLNHLNYSSNNIDPYIFIAYAPKSYSMNLGRCYNDYMERLSEGEFALFIDHDAMFTHDSWYDLISKISNMYVKDIALFISRTNRINNPYQRLNLLENNHRIDDHKVFANEVYKRHGCSTTECSQLPSSSGVIIMLSKTTWNRHKFADGFLKVDNKMHISLRESGDLVHLMNGLHVYHFYRADNDMSHVVRNISLIPEYKEVSSLDHKVKNFVYRKSSFQEIDRYMKLLGGDEYGIFLPEQSMFANKDWYLRATDYIEKNKDAGLLIFNDNGLDPQSPFGLDALEHKIYAAGILESNGRQLNDIDYAAIDNNNRAFMVSKELWVEAKKKNLPMITISMLAEVAKGLNKKAIFLECVYVFNSKIDNRLEKSRNYFDDKLNIAMLTMGFWPSLAGMEMMIHNLAYQSTKAGDNVVLFAPQPKSEFEEIKRNYIIRRFKDFEHMKLMFKQHHNSMPFDAIYVQGAFEPASVALELKKEFGVPVILRTHGEDIQIDKDLNYGYRLDPKKNEVIINNIRGVDHNIVIGPHVLVDVKRITNGPVSLIFNGVDTDHFIPGKKSLIHKKLNLSENTKILLTVGRNVKKKSLHLAIDALVMAKQIYTDVVLVHVGKEGNGKNLMEYANNLGVSDSFFQLGEISYFDMPEIYQSADIFVFPSKTETFGNVTVEAMSCGLPCVEFDYEVNRDKIISEISGYIIEYGDTKLLSEKIIHLLTSPELCNEMGRNGRKHAVGKFSWENVRKQYKEIFLKYAKKSNYLGL